MTRTLAHPPLSFTGAALWQKAAAVLVGSWVLAASAQIAVPMLPVPMTMQSFAVVLIGALCGWRMAGATVVAYLAQSFTGAPFLAGGAGGPMAFVGPTAGYLFAFLPAAMLAGWCAERGLTKHLIPAVGVMLAAHVVIFVGGLSVLTGFVGAEQAVVAGLLPFIPGTILKSGLAALIVRGVARG
jgi:biotin transport system substrate-specific component